MKMIGKVNYKDEVLEIDLTGNFGSFEPQYLLYLSNITQINIAGCTEIEPTFFVDCIGSCTKLVKFEMQGCIQFSEKMLVKIFNNLPNLRYIDCTACVEVTFASGYNIVAPLKQLLNINLEPKFANLERADWKRLIQIFRLVTFGHSIMRIFPHYGRYVRFPLYENTDEE